MSNTHEHSLTIGLIGILRKLGLKVKTKNDNRIHIQRDLELSHSEFCNLQKLRYWGLIFKVKINGVHQAGYWGLTRNGSLFLNNLIDMPKKVATQDNHKIGESDHKVRITDFYRNYTEEVWQMDFKGINFEQPSLF